jgi:tetratricopeptide (TPR) repeat protein
VPIHLHPSSCIQAVVPIDIVHRVIKIPEYLNKDPDLYQTVGFTYLKLKRYDEAIANYDKALKIDPYRASTLLFKGVILAILGQYYEAIGCYEQALETDPKDATVNQILWLNKGRALDDIG